MDTVDMTTIDAAEKLIATCLGEIPVAGGFASLSFTSAWDLYFADRKLAEQRAAMDSLFQAMSRMIEEALAQLVVDEASAYNSTFAQSSQDYAVSVQSFKDNPGSDPSRVVTRFESCKTTVTHMLNLFSQPSYMKQLLLSYGTALTMYVGLLKEIINSGADVGYSTSEILDFQNDINDRLSSAFKVMYDATCKIVKENREFVYPRMAETMKLLQQSVAGLMSFNPQWYNKPCLTPQEFPYLRSDAVDSRAIYQLQFRSKAGAPQTYYTMPQVFMPSRWGLHVYTDVLSDLELARFAPEATMDVRLRAYYLVDDDEDDSSNVTVTISTYSNPQVASFNLRDSITRICTSSWVKIYTPDLALSTDKDKFSNKMRMCYDEYKSISVQGETPHTITTKAGSSAVKNYYIIGFELLSA